MPRHRPLIHTATALTLTLPVAALANPMAFQDPATAAWGGWSRGSVGTLFAGWNDFDRVIDQTPDLGRHNATTAVIATNNPGAFISGSRNIYSFADVNDFDAIFVPGALGAGLFTVAVQISVLGNDIAASSLLLNGLPWSSRIVLATGSAGAPPGVGGTGTGVDNEYLFLWSNFERVTAQDIFALEFNAVALHNSLDALTIDVGPAPAAPPQPVSVPIPGVLGFLAGALGLLGQRRLLA